jgi:succinate-acetate transporter protein
MLNENVATDAHAQIYLQPIAALSILGLYGLAGATFMVAAHMAHWFGTSATSLYLFPFAAIFGGLAQFLAGMWAFRARDGVATAVHGMWGSCSMP